MAGVAVKDAVFGSIKAREVVVVDSKGTIRARLGGYVTTDEGSNAMITLDFKHRMAATMVAGPDQSQAGARHLEGGD